MIENYNVFKGIKQVFESTYTALTNSQKEGYLWFVRKDTATTVGDIHFGTKQYSEVDTPIPNATIDAIWDDVMNPGTISFTIDGLSFTAESGMTWSEWVNTEYNSDGAYVIANGYVANGMLRGYYVTYEGSSRVGANDTITDGMDYDERHFG